MTSCACGSELPAHEVNDARGIYIGLMCEECESSRLSSYRPEVLTDPNYSHSEPIDDAGGVTETIAGPEYGLFEGATLITIDPGNCVLCDLCNADYTDSPDSGGFMFESKACCPKCAPDFEKSAEGYGEAHMIGSRCPAGVSFADWVRQSCR